MEHPLISNIDHLNVDELQTKVNDLSRKLSWAQRSGNGQLYNQIQMAIESYKNKLYEKQNAMYEAMKKHGPDFSDKIDISWTLEFASNLILLLD